MLRGLRLHKTDKYLIRMVFGGSVLSSIVDVAGTICIRKHVGGLATIELVFQLKVRAQCQCSLKGRPTVNDGFQGAVALLVSNFVVVIPCIYRLFTRTGQYASIPISIHIDGSPARTTTADRLVVPPLSQAGHAVVRDERSQGVPAHLTSRISDYTRTFV